MKHSSSKFTSLLGVFALAAAMFLAPAHGAKALTISPPTFDYTLNPGDTVLDVIKVYNESPEPLTVYPILQNFTSNKEEGGEPQFYPADQNPDGTALAPWITVEQTPITLEPSQRANLSFAINVPKEGVQPGGHYGAILLSTTPPTESGKVGIASQLGVLLLVRINGDVKEIGTLPQFGFKHPQIWYNHLPVDFFIRFENDGNTHLRPTGNLFIKDWMGRQVAAIPVNEDFRSVLPNSIRRYEFGWKKLPNLEGKDFMSELKNEWRNFALGKYRAQLVLTYGSNNQILSEEREFTVWPWRILCIAGAGLVVLILLVTLLMKAYNRAVIRRYERDKAKQK